MGLEHCRPVGVTGRRGLGRRPEQQVHPQERYGHVIVAVGAAGVLHGGGHRVSSPWSPRPAAHPGARQRTDYDRCHFTALVQRQLCRLRIRASYYSIRAFRAPSRAAARRLCPACTAPASTAGRPPPRYTRVQPESSVYGIRAPAFRQAFRPSRNWWDSCKRVHSKLTTVPSTSHLWGCHRGEGGAPMGPRASRALASRPGRPAMPVY